MNVPPESAIREQTWFERNFYFIFVGALATFIFSLLAIIATLIMISYSQALDLAEAESNVLKSGLTCSELLDRPYVKRIMGAR